MESLLSIYIDKPQIIHHNGQVQYSVHVSFSNSSEILWYSLSEEYADLISERSDAPLVALLIPAMALGEDIYIQGTISERLYYNLSQSYQRLSQIIIPSLHLIKIYPSKVLQADTKGSGVATGFSAGIDSFTVLADHWYADVPKGFRLTHLLFNNVGSHGHGDDGRSLFKERYARIRPTAERIGLPFIAIDTNMDDFYKRINFQQTHTSRNASIALLLQRGIGRYLYASTFKYTDAYIGPSYDSAYSDTITLPLLSTGAIDIFSTGSEYSRVEKTLRVANIEDSHLALDICVKGHKAGNCSICWKCKRTLLTLEIAGLVDRYEKVFDLDAYRRVREFYIAEVLRSSDPLLREIALFAKEQRFQIPDSSRSFAYTLLNVVTKQARRMLNLFARIAGYIPIHHYRNGR